MSEALSYRSEGEQVDAERAFRARIEERWRTVPFARGLDLPNWPAKIPEESEGMRLVREIELMLTRNPP